MATKLVLASGRRDVVGGPITRLSGQIESDMPGGKYFEVFVTDCERTLKIPGRVPSANKGGFSYTIEAENTSKHLDASRDWYVYARTTSRRTGATEFSNAYLFPADKKIHRDTEKNIRAIKAGAIGRITRAIRGAEREIRSLNRDVQRALDRATSLSDWYVPILPEWYLEHARALTDRMADLRKKTVRLERERERRRKDLEEKFTRKPGRSHADGR